MKLSDLKPALLLTGGFFLLALQGCSSVALQSDKLLETKPPEFMQPQEISDVAFTPQREYQCGPAALATVLQWRDVSVTADDLVDDVYLPGRKGSLQVEMLATVRRYDRVPYVIERKMDALLQEVRAGNPVLVLQNLGLEWHPFWHYAVVIGYDLANDKIILRSGEVKRHINSFSLFERTWRRANYWGLVVLPVDRLPASSNAFSYLKSVVPFEQLHKNDIALKAYKNALQKWPQDTNLLMAAGNASYIQKELINAEKYYRQVIQNAPDYAPALNNLAQVLSEQQHYKAAKAYAEKAILHADKYKAEYKKTLHGIMQKMSYSRH